jgi:DNA-binding MarR family transcriptional regulator
MLPFPGKANSLGETAARCEFRRISIRGSQCGFIVGPLITTYITHMSHNLSVSPKAAYAECFGLNLRRAARVVGRRYDEALRPIGLNNGQFATLCVIAAFDPLSMHGLAEHLSMDRTTLTAALKPLKRRGLVSNRFDKQDRRTRIISLTDDGMQLLAEAIPLWKKVQRRISGEMGTGGLPVFRAQLALLSSANSDVEGPSTARSHLTTPF